MTNQENFRQSIKTQLESQPIDDETRDALRAARYDALDSTARTGARAWIPASAIAVLVMLIGGALLLRGVDEVQMPTVEAEDLAVIASEDELEFFEELEFYVWYEEENKV